jgi:hypothetical protein
MIGAPGGERNAAEQAIVAQRGSIMIHVSIHLVGLSRFCSRILHPETDS